MTQAQLKLASALLRRAADEFSRHGCNDFDLVRDGTLTSEEADGVRRALIADKMIGEDARNVGFDWLLMAWLSKVCGEP